MEASPLPTRAGPIREVGPKAPTSGVTAGILLGSAALLFVLAFARAPLYLLALPAVVIGTMASLARPAAGFFAIIGMSGFIGTLIAFTGLPVGSLTEIGLLCLWFAAIGLYATGRAERRVWLWPALILPIIYLLLTTVQMFTSEDLELAFLDYRITAWYMLAMVLVAVGPWDLAIYRRVARGLIVVAVLVGMYALYRYIVGPSPEEFLQARGAVQRVSVNVPVRFFGSFLSAFQLAAWCGTALPFLLALSFVSERRWRVGAILAVALCIFAVFASDVRTGLVAASIGMAAVVVLFLFSRAFQVERLAMGFLALLGVALVGLAGYGTVVSGSDETADRFSRIFTPTEDQAFQERLTRWDEAIDVIDREPFGYGLGTQGFIGQSKNEEGQTGPFNLDSAYLKIGIQQGYLVMALFIFALLVLLAGLIGQALRTTDRWRCALGIGAAGALVSQMFLFFAGIYSEGVTALSAWMLIGVGAAQFTTLPGRKGSAPDPERRLPDEPG